LSISGSERPRPLAPLLLLAGVALAVLMVDRAIHALAFRLLAASEQPHARLYLGDPAGAEPGTLLVLGHSRARHAFPARLLSRHLCRPVLGLAHDGLGMESVAALGADALDRRPGLDAALIEVSALFGRDLSRTDLALYAGQSPRLARLVAEGTEARLPWTRLFRSAVLNGQLFWRGLYHIGRGAERARPAGAAPAPGVLAAFRAAPPRRLIPAPDAVAALRSLVARLDAAGVRTVLIVAPLHPVARAHWGPADWPRTLAARLGRPVLDLGGVLDAVPAGFTDPLHTSVQGARATLRHLPGDLSRCGDGPG